MISRNKLPILAALIFVIAFSRCLNQPPKKDTSAIRHPNGETFAGSLSCRSCHKEIYESFIKTAHHLTSAPASPKTVKGSFQPGLNTFVFNDRLKVVMSKKENQLFQELFFDNKKQFSFPFDISIGSGRKGQSYLYFRDKQLFQLPVSYYAPSNSWINSPGYPQDIAVFDRAIQPRCLECHSTLFEVIPGQENQFNKNAVIYGIECERCHGPASKHVEYHTANPQAKNAFYITKIYTLSRQQQLEQCGLCHSGMAETLKSGFAFAPGDRLNNYLKDSGTPDSAFRPDVHGHQYQLLKESLCFKMSASMTCSTCHNTHQTERDLAVFSTKCRSCHNGIKGQVCKKTQKEASLLTNCIDCHMPANPSKAITVQNSGDLQQSPVLVRSHRIAIYPAEDRHEKNYSNLTSSSVRNFLNTGKRIPADKIDRSLPSGPK